MEFDRFNSIEGNANKLFPGHSIITFRTFDMAQTRYFKYIKPMPLQLKVKYFENTYYCKNGIYWFSLDGIKYFCIFLNPGSVQEYKYYGTIKL